MFKCGGLVKNFLNASEENGGPSSVVIPFGGPYWEISDFNLLD